MELLANATAVFLLALYFSRPCGSSRCPPKPDTVTYDSLAVLRTLLLGVQGVGSRSMKASYCIRALHTELLFRSVPSEQASAPSSETGLAIVLHEQ
jgi:hypothetical protein